MQAVDTRILEIMVECSRDDTKWNTLATKNATQYQNIKQLVQYCNIFYTCM